VLICKLFLAAAIFINIFYTYKIGIREIDFGLKGTIFGYGFPLCCYEYIAEGWAYPKWMIYKLIINVAIILGTTLMIGLFLERRISGLLEKSGSG